MRLALKVSALFLAWLAVGLAVALHYPRGVFAFNSGGPNLNTLEGQPTCAGPPTAGNLLGFRNGTWCDTNSIVGIFSGYLNTTSGVGASTTIAQFTSSTQLHLIRFSGNFITGGAGCTTAPVISVNVAGDLADAHCVMSGVSNCSGNMTDVPGAASIIQIQLLTAGVGCTTFPAGINYNVVYSAG